MNKSDLIQKIADKKNPLSKNDIEESVNSLLNFISQSLHISDRVEIRNFGTFSVRYRARRLSRNPKLGTSVYVQSKRHPYFRASKYLKESLNI
tara:strand:+ start:393 stop:671 length:279 start_codon:yes stop_codon:yes gene_type:complete